MPAADFRNGARKGKKSAAPKFKPVPTPDTTDNHRGVEKANAFKKTPAYAKSIRAAYGSQTPQTRQARVERAEAHRRSPGGTFNGLRVARETPEDRIILAEHNRRQRRLDVLSRVAHTIGDTKNDISLGRAYVGSEASGHLTPHDSHAGHDVYSSSDAYLAQLQRSLDKGLGTGRRGRQDLPQELAAYARRYGDEFAFNPSEPPADTRTGRPQDNYSERLTGDLREASGLPRTDEAPKRRGGPFGLGTLNPLSSENFLEGVAGEAIKGVHSGLEQVAGLSPVAKAVIGGIPGGAALVGASASPEVATNAAHDALDFYAQAVPSIAFTVSHPKKAAEAVLDQITHPGRSLKEHPLFFPLLAHGGIRAGGRIAGVSLRTAGRVKGLEGLGKVASTQGRAPILDPLTGKPSTRIYSGDLVAKYAQKAGDRLGRRLQAGAAARREAGKPAKLRDTLHLKSQAHNMKRNADYLVGENTRRLNRSQVRQDFAKARPRKFGDLVAFINDATVKSAKTMSHDLAKERDRLTVERDKIAAEMEGKTIGPKLTALREKLKESEASIARVQSLLDNKHIKSDPQKAFEQADKAAQGFAERQAEIDRLRVERGDLVAAQAEKAKYINWAVREMGAKMDHEARLTDAGTEHLAREGRIAELDKQIKQAERSQQNARVFAAREEGGSKVAVAHEDQKAVNSEAFVRSTRKVHLKNVRDVQAARKSIDTLKAEGAPKAKLDKAQRRLEGLLNEREKSRAAHDTARETAAERLTQPVGRQRAELPAEPRTGREHEVGARTPEALHITAREVAHSTFQKGFRKARKEERGPFLTHYTDNQRRDEGHRTFTAHAGKVGGALKPRPDGGFEVISVYRLPGAPKGSGAEMVRHLVEQGGTHLDCFDMKQGPSLVDIYGPLGFRETERMKWDDQYAPPDWNYERYGRPDVVAMEYDAARAHPGSEGAAQAQARGAKRGPVARAGAESGRGSDHVPGADVHGHGRAEGERRASRAGTSVERKPLVPALGTKPTRRLKRLESVQGELHARTTRLERLRRERKAAKKDLKDNYVLKDHRTFIPGLTKDGEPLSVEQIRDTMKDSGVNLDRLAFISSRKFGASAGYVSPSRAPYERRFTLTGATRQFSVHSELDALNSQMRGQGVIDALDNRLAIQDQFVKPAAYSPDGTPLYHDTYAGAVLHAKHEEAVTGHKMTVYRVHDPRLTYKQFEQYKRNLDTSDEEAHMLADEHFEASLSPAEGVMDEAAVAREGTPNGKFGVMAADVAKQLQAHEQVTSKLAIDRGIQAFTQRWRHAILHGSSFHTWTMGNTAELMFRLAVAGAGPRSLFVGRKILAQLDKALEEGRIDKQQHSRTRAILLSGGHFTGTQSLVIRDAFRDDRGAMLKSLQDLADKPVLKHLRLAWETWTRGVLAVNRTLEHGGDVAALGKLALSERETFRAFNKTWVDGLTIGKEAAAQVANRLLETPEQIRYARHIYKVIGNYTTLPPSVRKLIGTYSTFGLWYGNAIKFLYFTLPKDHPLVTATLAATYVASEKDRKELGAGMFLGDDRLPDFLQGSVHLGHLNVPFFPDIHEGTYRFNRYLPFGAVGDPAVAANQILPQFEGVTAALRGVDFKDSPLLNSKDKKLDAAERAIYALYSTLETMVPFASNVRKAREKGGKPYATSYLFSPKTKKGTQDLSIEGALARAFNPLAPVKNSGKKAAGASSSLPSLPGLPPIPGAP